MADDTEDRGGGGKKMTQLLLNTPGACFLCLQNNDGGADPVENLNGGIIDLTNICRHLNINQCALLSTSLKNDGGDTVEELEQNPCTFSVKLCPKCLELTKKLNDMIIKLEEVKLMVNYHLSSFHKVLEGKEQKGSLEWINLLGRIHANSDNSFEAKLVQLLREQVQDKSVKILKKAEVAMSQVTPSKCQGPPQPAPIITPSSNSVPSMKTLLSRLVTSSAIPSKKPIKSRLFRCPYCTKVLGPSKIGLHLSCLHPSKLLSSYFPPSSSKPPSEDICRQVLSSQVITQAAKIQSGSSPRLACHLCGITYGHGNLLKQHFLITHTDQLIAEIINFEKRNPSRQNIQNKPPLPHRPKKRPPTQLSNSVDQLIKNLVQTCVTNASSKNDKDTGSKRYQCPFCEDSMANSKCLPRHFTNFHPDKLLAHFTPSILDKLKKDNPNKFTQLCGKVLASQLSLAVKLQVSSKLGCHLCAREFPNGRDLKHHFLLDHTDNLCEELIKIKNMKIRGKDKLKKRPMVIKKEKTCLICGQTFSKADKLPRHQASKHPDQLFLKGKPSWIGGEKFGVICKEIFGGEVKKGSFGKAGNKYFKCGYCSGGKRYARHADLVVHLAERHREEMEGKLKNKLEEEEDEGRDNGLFCGGDEVVIEEEDGGEFDVKPEVGGLGYTDMDLDELGREEGEVSTNYSNMIF